MLRGITMTTLVTLLALSSVAGAAERRGELALGFSSADAPVGVRYFTSDRFALDVGLGFESTDVVVDGTGDTDTATNFFVEGGATYILYDYLDSYFFVRPAIMFASFDDLAPTGLESRFRGELNLGAEVRLADHFGLTFEHGIAVQSDSPQDDGDSLTTIETLGQNATRAGVWFTF
ncbi:MAG TPA: hypothetical protein VKA86_07200 [Candidatus Krumholzibacteria bacterium]|nr:hypothetical protein [Candidatus Krumholzibacteria bacterium]